MDRLVLSDAVGRIEPQRVRAKRGPMTSSGVIGRSGRAPPDIVHVDAVPVQLIGRHQFTARTHKSNSIGAGLANVRYAPASDQIPHRNEMTRCARRRPCYSSCLTGSKQWRFLSPHCSRTPAFLSPSTMSSYSRRNCGLLERA